MPYANVNDVRMYYEETGRPHSPALVLLNRAPHDVQDPHLWIGGPQAHDFLERNSSALMNVSPA